MHFNLTAGEISKVADRLLATKISSVVIEFMETQKHPSSITEEVDNSVNNSILRMDLDVPFVGWNGRRYECVRLSMTTDPDVTRAMDYMFPGILQLKPIPYPKRSNQPRHTCELHRTETVFTLRQLIATLTDKKMEHFNFAFHSGRCCGCRNFVTQAVYQLTQAGYVRKSIKQHTPTGPLAKEDNILVVLGMKFQTSKRPVPARLDKGQLTHYERVVDYEKGMQYAKTKQK